ncbi:MAG: Histidine kinase [Caulobacteraceae bacterium]|nr:Histidine kinase [Caulobacteraceae bacterium]
MPGSVALPVWTQLKPAKGLPEADGARYRLLVDAITDYAIYMLDRQGRVASWNAGAQRFKGYEPREIIGEHFSRFYTEEDRATGLPERALSEAAAQGRFEQEGWRVRKDGGRFWAHVVIEAIRDDDGEVIGFAKVTRDLTERRAAEQALRASEEQFRLLVQGVADYAIYMLDPGGHVASWNAGAQRFKGYRAEEIVGQHFSRFYTEDDRRRGVPEQALAAATREGRFEKEGWRVRKDGGRFWAHVVIDAIRDDDGRLLGFAKITRDITERMEAQRALEAAQHALFQSQKLESIGQLTGGIAHDFNNLLTAISGSLELLRKYLPDDRKALGLHDNAMQGVQRGASLTQRMLAFARRQELTPEPIDVSKLVEGMIGLIERSIGPTIRVKIQFPAALPRARTDANQLEAALLNLVVNARDAMPGGGTLAVTAREEAVDGVRYVCLSVVDTGKGMDEVMLSRAMEPFFTTKGVGKGTGLGLSMVHGLAEQSGGRLILSSRVDEGTTAEIWLPATEEESRPRPAPEQGPVAVAPMVILVVDDDPLVLANTAAMLEDLGHTVAQAASGAEALEIVVRDPAIDLVISDHAMPEMTGLELAGVIKAGRPDLPLILATGYAELPPDADPTLPRLAKPFTQRELALMVAGARAAFAARAPAASPGGR